MMLLDEPTAGMGHDDVDRIVELVKRVRDGRTILMVEHNLSVVEGLCDTITVLTRGRVLTEGDYATVRRTRTSSPPIWGRRMLECPMLEVRSLNAWYGESHILHGMEFEVREGEVVTLLGRNGAGKTTTLKSIMGLVPRREGSIRFRGAEPPRLMPHHIARHGIAFCPEERGIFGSLSVTENLLLPPVVAPGGLDIDDDLHAVPQPEGTRAHGARHAAVRRRAADAGDRADLANRREDAAAGRADRGPRAGHRAADRPHHPRDQEPGFTVLLVEQNFRFAQTVADRHYVVEHGQVIDMIPNHRLEASMDKLHEYLGV